MLNDDKVFGVPERRLDEICDVGTTREFHHRYREFRHKILTSYPFDRRRTWAQVVDVLVDRDAHTRGKDLIRHFRKSVAESFDCFPPDQIDLACHALGLPSDPTITWRRLFRRPRWLWWAISPHTLMLRLRSRLSDVTTYEGRALVVERAATVGTDRPLITLDPALDYRLRHFVGMPDKEQIVDAHALGVSRMRVAHHLGVRTGHELTQIVDTLLAQPASFLVAWQQHGLLKTPEDLALAELPKRFMFQGGMDEWQYGVAFWRCLELLRKAGAGMESLRTVHRTRGPYELTAETLTAVAAQLRQHAIPLDEALIACGSSVWLASPSRWHFLLEIIGARSAVDCAAFKDLFVSDNEPSTSLVQDLRRRGAGLTDLARWQRWIVAYDYKHQVPTAGHLDQLIEAGLTLSDLPAGPAFLAADAMDTFMPFAIAARAIGAVRSADMLALHTAFAARDHRTVLDLLPLRSAFGNPSFEEWGRFLTEVATNGGRSDSVRYLRQIYGLGDLSKRGQIVQLCQLDSQLLAYLYSRRKLHRWRQLTRWHYDHGWGSEAIRLGNLPIELEAAVLDEAWRRDTYYTVAGTLHTLFMELYATARATNRTREDLAVILLERLPTLYAAGEGVLLPSLIREGMSPNLDLRAALRDIKRARTGLLNGLGPVGQELDSKQMEAVAHAYSVAHEDVRVFWPKVVGLQRQVSAFVPVVARRYGMRWSRRHLVCSATPPDSQLNALAQVGKWAELWARDGAGTAALQTLDRQRLRDPSASLESLAGHWALLLALLHEDSTVRPWFSRLGELLRDPVTAPADLATLDDWIHERLPEAVRVLDPNSNSFPHLIKVFPRAVGEAALTPKDAASTLLGCLSPVLTRWLGELRRSAFSDANGETELTATVSKAPAAFFSRKATALCTAADVDMWQEPRHAHLVVFDPNTTKLAGMAMLYVQQIPEIDMRRTTLVMRAINLPLSLREAYVRESVLDECIRVANAIALAGGHAGPAFPPDTSQHLVSNDGELAKLMVRRYETATFRRVPLSRRFYCYRLGAEIGSVDELFVLNSSVMGQSLSKSTFPAT